MKPLLISIRTFKKLTLLLAFAALLTVNPQVTSAQAGALTPNHRPDNQFRPMPKRPQTDSHSVSESPKVRIDKMVYKASFDQQPHVDPTMASELPWTYQLRNLNYEQFEGKLAEIWGDRLLGQALDEQQRMLRIYFPEGRMAPESSMKFDRLNGMATYEGDPSRKKGWHELMRVLDRNETPNSIYKAEVIDVGHVDQSYVQLVSAQFRTQDQDERGGQDSVEIPANQFPDLSQADEISEILGNVTLRVFPETNTIFIIGDAESVAKIKAVLKRLNEAPGTAADVRTFKLQYNDPAEIVDSVSQLYEDRFSTVLGAADIIATPTGLLAAGTPKALEAIEKIVNGLEGGTQATVPPENVELSESEKGYRRFVLKYINVVDAQRAVDALFGQSANLANNQNRQVEPVQTLADQLNNALTVYANPERLRRAAELIKEIDVPKSDKQKSRVLKVFQIRNHGAGDFAILLQNILTQGLQPNEGLNETTNNQTQNTNQVRQEQFSNNQQTTQPFTAHTLLQLLLDGRPTPPTNFFDTRITSDAPSNTIQVVASAEAMPIIGELIDILDKLPDLSSEVKVFSIVNGDAQQILDTLDQIFGGNQQQGGQGGANQTGSLTNLPLQSPGSDGASLINIRFAINERTNTIIASGSAGDLEFVEALIYRLDERDVQDRQTAIYRLSNASVLEASTAINNLLDQREAIVGANPRTDSLTEVARRDVIVVEEETSNSLIVNARPEYFPEIDAIINALDRRPPMVKVKAMIVQVDLNQLENFGVEFGLQDSDIFGANLSDTIGSGFVGLDQPAGQLLSDLGVGRASSAAGGLSGLLLSAGDDSLNFVLRFLKQKGCASVLFKPHVMTMENLEGRFRQGAQIQRATGSTLTGVGNVQQQFVETPIGLQLGITPRVSPDGMIVMFVDVENSSLGLAADGTVIGVDGAGNAIISQPINETVVQTTVMARSGQTVVLSGLIQEQKGQTINSVPFLGDLPVVGPIFQSVENTADRTEILIFLTPYLVDGEDDLSALNQDDFERMNWCKEDVAEAYGTTSYTGAPYTEQYPKIYYPDQDPRGVNPDFQGLDEPITPFENSGSEIEGIEPEFQDEGWRNRENAPNNGSSSRAMPMEYDHRHHFQSARQNQPSPYARSQAEGDGPNLPIQRSRSNDSRQLLPAFNDRGYRQTDQRQASSRPVHQFQPIDEGSQYPVPPHTPRAPLKLNSKSTGAKFKLH